MRAVHGVLHAQAPRSVDPADPDLLHDVEAEGIPGPGRIRARADTVEPQLAEPAIPGPLHRAIEKSAQHASPPERRVHEHR